MARQGGVNSEKRIRKTSKEYKEKFRSKRSNEERDLERSKDKKRKSEKRLNMTSFEVKVEEYLNALVSKIVTACEENNYDGEIDTWDMAWTFPNALLFTVTIMTTVGYGHISPKSSSGV